MTDNDKIVKGLAALLGYMRSEVHFKMISGIAHSPSERTKGPPDDLVYVLVGDQEHYREHCGSSLLEAIEVACCEEIGRDWIARP